METILITGAAGFIGSHLQNILKPDFHLLGMDVLATRASIQRAQMFPDLIKASVHGSFLDDLTSKPDLVIHLAAETGIPASLQNPELYFRQNVEGTFNVLEQCRKNGVKYLIYASSSSVYSPNQVKMTETARHDHQLSFYGTTKRMAEILVENYCKQFGITAIGLRFFTVYGSRTRTDMAAYKFMNAIQRGNAVTLYNNGEVYRDFTHVSDVVKSIKKLAKKIITEPEGSHQIFNIGYGNPISVKQYAELIAKNLEKDLIVQSALLPENELPSTHSDCTKLADYINYRPVCGIEEGIKEMTDWFLRENT